MNIDKQRTHRLSSGSRKIVFQNGVTLSLRWQILGIDFRGIKEHSTKADNVECSELDKQVRKLAASRKRTTG